MNTVSTFTLVIPSALVEEMPWVVGMRLKPNNGTSQAKLRREIRRRSNLPKAIQKRLGFKCH